MSSGQGSIQFTANSPAGALFLGAENGLTMVAGKVRLGGQLIVATNVDANSFVFTITNGANPIFRVSPSTNSVAIGNASNPNSGTRLAISSPTGVIGRTGSVVLDERVTSLGYTDYSTNPNATFKSFFSSIQQSDATVRNVVGFQCTPVTSGAGTGASTIEGFSFLGDFLGAGLLQSYTAFRAYNSANIGFGYKAIGLAMDDSFSTDYNPNSRGFVIGTNAGTNTICTIWGRLGIGVDPPNTGLTLHVVGPSFINGSLGAGFPQNASSVNANVSALVLPRGIITNAGAAASITITLDQLIQGYDYTFTIVNAFNIVIQASGGARLRNGALITAVNGTLTGSTQGSSIRIVLVTGNIWQAVAVIGAWV